MIKPCKTCSSPLKTRSNGRYCSEKCRAEALPTREWFDARVDRSGGVDACWPWLRGALGSGYGRLTIGYRSLGAHVMALWLHLGRKPIGFVLHSCDNPRCCNPAHLREGTVRDNAIDMVSRGRHRNQWSR